MKLQFLGSGDAFGSGGRFNTCFYVEHKNFKFLIDCGASSLIAMKRFNIDPLSIDCILLSHLHGDHFGGIPFLERETQIEARRNVPLMVVGPPQTESKITEALEVFFPGSTHSNAYEQTLDIKEYESGTKTRLGEVNLLALPTIHTPGTNPHALRIELDHKVIAYSGDTEWHDNLTRVAYNSDLFICECYKLSPKKNHMDYQTLLEKKDELGCKRIITHMSKEVLDAAQSLSLECAEDGKVITF